MKTKALFLALIGSLTLVCLPLRGAQVIQLTVEQQAATDANWLVEIGHADLTETATNTAQTLTNLFSVAAKTSVELVAMQLVTAFDTGNTNFTGSCALKIGDGTDDDRFLTSTELASDGTEVFLKFGPDPTVGASTTRTNVTGVTLTTTNIARVTDATLGTTSIARMTDATLTTTNIVRIPSFVVASVTITNLEAGVTNVRTFVTGVTPTYATNALASAINKTFATNALGSSLTKTYATNALGRAVSLTTAAQASLTSIAESVGRKVYTVADYVDFTFTPNLNEALSANSSGKVLLYFRVRPQT